MASVVYAMEKYRNATRVLATRPGRIKERLAIAVLDIMDCQDCVPIMEDWCNVREETQKLWRRLNSKQAIRSSRTPATRSRPSFARSTIRAVDGMRAFRGT
jgi:hypothetical protein